MDELHNLIEEKDVDMVVFPAIDYDEDTGTYNKHEYFSMSELFGLVANTVVDWKDLGNLIFKISVTPWSKLYKHEIIKKCQARFPLNLIYHDNPFFWEVLFNSKRIYFYDRLLYTRRIHSASCTNSHDERNIDSIMINNLVIGIFLKYGHFDEYKHDLYNNKIGLVNTRYEEIRDEFKELFFTEMKRDYMKIIGHERYDEFRSELDRDCFGYFNNVVNSQNHVEYDLRNQILRLEFAYVDMSNEIERLSRENKELAELNESLLSSKSWKITEPLRKLRNR